MPLTACPDCAREVSTQAPACIRCGRPLATSSSPANVRERPMAGIAAALLVGLTSLVIAVLFITDEYDVEMRRLQWAGKIAHVVGNLPLLAGALMSLAGNARGNRLVRATSKGMIVVILALLAWSWIVLAGRGMADGAIEKPNWAPLILMFAVIGTAPWLLYLYLFRASRHP